MSCPISCDRQALSRAGQCRGASLVALVLLMSGCGDGGNSSPGRPPVVATPSPTPTPTTPTPTPPSTAQFPVPFGLTADRILDVFGWQGSTPATTVGFRWNAQATSYELMMPGEQWGRLAGSNPYLVYNANGTQQPYSIRIDWNEATTIPPRIPQFSAEARVTQLNGTIPTAWFAYGLATEPGDVPLTGTRTCHYSVDDDGDGTLAFDLATGAITGNLMEFWGTCYELPATQFTPGSTTFTAAGPLGPIEGRFFGPQAQEVVIRWLAPTNNSTIQFYKLWIMVCDLS